MRLGFLYFVLILASCGTGPGAPPEVPANSREHFVLPGCRNVQPQARSTKFITDFYLTTWGSALGEGATVGVREGVGTRPYGAGALIAAVLPKSTRLGGDELVPRRGAAEEFCILIKAPEGRVKRAQMAAFRELQKLGYSFVSVSSGAGYIQTRFKKSGHRAALWYDRYSASTYPIDSTTTAVFVLREVFISRSGAPYVQGRSVGANEASILTRIRDLALASNG